MPDSSSFNKIFIIELFVYLSQVFIFFCVTVMLSNMLSSKNILTSYVTSKINSYSVKEVFYIVIATIFTIGILYVLKIIFGKNFNFMDELIDEVLNSIPRTIYFFGSTVTGIMLAIALFVHNHLEIKSIPAKAWIFNAFFFSIVMFAYGFIFKLLLYKNKLNNSNNSSSRLLKSTVDEFSCKSKNYNVEEKHRPTAIKVKDSSNIVIKNILGIGNMDLLDVERVENLDAEGNKLIIPENKKIKTKKT